MKINFLVDKQETMGWDLKRSKEIGVVLYMLCPYVTLSSQATKSLKSIFGPFCLVEGKITDGNEVILIMDCDDIPLKIYNPVAMNYSKFYKHILNKSNIRAYGILMCEELYRPFDNDVAYLITVKIIEVNEIGPDMVLIEADIVEDP